MFSIWFNENTIPQTFNRYISFNVLQNRIWLIGFRVMSSFVQVVISQNELKLLGSMEKWITLR